jgi:cephalosporin-C deacetylase-like acetyl esterase
MTGHDEQYYKDYGNKVNGIAPGAPARASYALACADYDNPKDTYFYYMAMRVMRAFDYLKSLPEWDGKNLMAEGGSQGGLQTMWAAGLVDGLSEARPRITWGCDIGCPFDGKGPFPSRVWGIPSVPGAFYFDSALHAKRVPSTCRVEITRLGLGDYTCPPRGVLLSYYNLKGPAKANLVQGATHGYVPPMPNQTFVISK